MQTIALMMICLFAMVGARRMSRCCCDFLCLHCNTEETPTTIQIEFDGTVNNDCDECGDFNTTTFVLTADGDDGVLCFWQLGTPLPCDSEADLPVVCMIVAISGSPPSAIQFRLLVDNCVFGIGDTHSSTILLQHATAGDCSEVFLAQATSTTKTDHCTFDTVDITPQAPFL